MPSAAGGAPRLLLDEVAALTEQRAGQLIALDDALQDLAALDERKSQIIELRFFGGLSMEETAECNENFAADSSARVARSESVAPPRIAAPQ